MRPTLRGAAFVSFCCYVVWNICWLAHHRIPPSILLGVFGLPAPTTGCTRSLLCLLRGDWQGSFFWNAFLLPLILLILFTLVYLLRFLIARSRLVLPPIMGRLWLWVLLAAWVTKLAQGSTSW